MCGALKKERGYRGCLNPRIDPFSDQIRMGSLSAFLRLTERYRGRVVRNVRCDVEKSIKGV